MPSYRKIRYGLEWLSTQVMDEVTRRKFYNKNGDLNSYALACGYIQIVESLDEKIKIHLFADNQHYHVRVYSYRAEHQFMAMPWDVFTDLTHARNCFDKCIREYM